MQKSRRLLLKGLHNARDLGGFATRDGGVTKFGVFLRSEAPCNLDKRDVDDLIGCGVTGSVDMRSKMEREARPSDLKNVDSIICYEKPLFDEAVVPGANKIPPPTGQKQIFNWGKKYIEMAEESRRWALETLIIAAQHDGTLLYHCTTGKDRTGLLTCYILSIAGVSKADIAADYCVSQVYLAPVYEKMRSGDIRLGPVQKTDEGTEKIMETMKISDMFFKTPAEAMLELIGYLDETYGGVSEYLRQIGLPETVSDKIRTKLVQY